MSSNPLVEELLRLGNLTQEMDKLIRKALKGSDDLRAQTIKLIHKTKLGEK